MDDSKRFAVLHHLVLAMPQYCLIDEHGRQQTLCGAAPLGIGNAAVLLD